MVHVHNLDVLACKACQSCYYRHTRNFRISLSLSVGEFFAFFA